MARSPHPRPITPARAARRLLTSVLGLLFASAVFGQAHRIAAPAPGLSESGAPPFVILGEEALGLNSPPTDLRLLPDGRILVAASKQLALGDGVRWEVFNQAPKDPIASGSGVGVDHDGHIYVGIPGGFARVEFGENNQWRLLKVAFWPESEPATRPALRSQVDVRGEWFWHSGSGSVLSWKPGQIARVVGRTDDVEHIFALHGAVYLSDRNLGRLSRLKGGAMLPALVDSAASPNSAITCALQFNDAELLVGTVARGLQRFDGESLQPFSAGSVLEGSSRINDLCSTEGDMLAAAVENRGIVFFTRTGRVVQALDRSLDHRLARVKRLVPAPGGVIWALLDHGILRVQFPSRISFFEPLIGTGVNTAHPYRLDGRLWFLADGKIYRGVYDVDGRLTGLELDMPPNMYVFAFAETNRVPIAGTEKGAYFRNESGWSVFAPEIDNLRVLEPNPRNGRWVYGARGEMGWLRPSLDGVEVERIPASELISPYNTVTDHLGQIWLELGNARFGRISVDGDAMKLETFGSEHGIPESWGQAFEINGKVHFNVAEQILQFDEPTRRFVADRAFQNIRPNDEIRGRPGVDAQGRLWVSTTSGVQVLENLRGEWQRLNEKMSPQFRPYYFTFEEGGVVWMHSEHRLERYDPAMPVVTQSPLRALITHVKVATNNRTFYSVDRELPALKYAENSLTVHFAALGNSFASAVTFDVKLEGAGSEWTPSGSSGSAVFNRLKEGRYTLHIRPVSDAEVGAEDSLSFVIRPPWYRSTLAYVGYGTLAVTLVLLAGWISTVLERRENVRLERIVAQRTRELNESNDRLGTQVEEIRMLSQAIEQSPVAVLITKPDGTIVFANPQASELSGYTAGELIGLNAALLRSSDHSSQPAVAAAAAAAARGESWRGQLVHRRKDGTVVHVQSMVSPLRSPDGTIRHHLILEEDITESLADQEKNRRLESQLFQAQKLESIGTLAGGIAHDFNNILTGILGYCELARLSAGTNDQLQHDLGEVRSAGIRAKDLVAQILTFSRQGHVNLVPLDISEPVSEAMKLVRASTPATVEIVSQIESGIVKADATQIQQVVLNLCTNAVHAMHNRTARLEVLLQRVEVTSAQAASLPHFSPGPCMRLFVSDNGCGMEQATLDRIFDPFFTTKRQGEGTGLGLAIVQAIAVGHHAALRVRSAVEAGTAFEIYFPITREAVPALAIETPVPVGDQQEILIVDDERSVAEFASVRLQQLGYRTTVFTDPSAVIDAFATQPNRFDAVVTDLTMPHLTGADLIQQIRSRGWLIPAVIITGYGGDLLRGKLKSLPRCIVLQKPFSGDELARALDQVINDYAIRT